MADTNQAWGDTSLVIESLEKPLLSEDDPEMPRGEIPAAVATAATASHTAADAAHGDDAPRDVDLTLSNVSTDEGDPVHDAHQSRGSRSSAESTECGTDGDIDPEDGDDNDDKSENEEDKKKEREIRRIMRQRTCKIEEKKEALRAMASVATLQLQAQPLHQLDALPQHDWIPLPSTTRDWEGAAEEVAKWLECTEDVDILQVKFDT